MREWEDEITYRRTMGGSFLVLPVEEEISDLDEKMLLQGLREGILSVEKNFLDEGGEYWYNITGKQPLAGRLGLQSLSMDLMDKLLTQLIRRIEEMEGCLLDENCLRLDPEFIFLDSAMEQVTFLAYPKSTATLAQQFHILMEGLLMRIDHRDQELVKAAYGLYERSAEESFSIADLREMVRKPEPVPVQEETAAVSPEVSLLIPEEVPKMEKPGRKEKKRAAAKPSFFSRLLEKMKGWIRSCLAGKEEEEQILFSYEESAPEAEQPKVPASNPTVCLSAAYHEPEGMLIYEGTENLTGLRLQQGPLRLGSGAGADLVIPKDTVSHCHALLEGKGDSYFIEDLNSTNGTYVNGDILSYKERRKLCPNDLIRFGDVKYRFV